MSNQSHESRVVKTLKRGLLFFSRLPLRTSFHIAQRFHLGLRLVADQVRVCAYGQEIAYQPPTSEGSSKADMYLSGHYCFRDGMPVDGGLDRDSVERSASNMSQNPISVSLTDPCRLLRQDNHSRSRSASVPRSRQGCFCDACACMRSSPLYHSDTELERCSDMAGDRA